MRFTKFELPKCKIGSRNFKQNCQLLMYPNICTDLFSSNFGRKLRFHREYLEIKIKWEGIHTVDHRVK